MKEYLLNVPVPRSFSYVKRNIPEVTVEQRERALKATHYNEFAFPAGMLTVDMLSDSGTTAMTDQQWSAMFLGDESYGRNKGYYVLLDAMRDCFERGDNQKKIINLVRTDCQDIEKMMNEMYLCEYEGGLFNGGAAQLERPNAFLMPQGRAAESILFEIVRKVLAAREPGKVFTIPSNGHFDTTEGNIKQMGSVPRNLYNKELLPFAKTRAEELAPFGDIRVNGKPHVRADERPWDSVLDGSKFDGTPVGENLAGNNLTNPYTYVSEKYFAEQFFKQWKSSPTHYENMMDSRNVSHAVGIKFSYDSYDRINQNFYGINGVIGAELLEKKIKELEDFHKSYPNIKVYSDNSENITVDEVETVDLSLEKVLQYYYTKNKRKKAKNVKLMLSLLTNTGTLKDNINLKEDNKELHSIVSYMLNEYPVEYNKKEVYWKDLSMKTKKKLLSRKVRVNRY